MYNNHIVLPPGNCYIHIPLVYKTKLHIQQELYGRALIEFVNMMDCNDILKPKLIDGVVVSFNTDNFKQFKQVCFDKLANNNFYQKKLFKNYLFINQWLPKYCLKVEQDFLNKTLRKSDLQRLYNFATKAIAINLANPFLEILYLRLNNLFGNLDEYQKLVSMILGQPMFSHILHFQQELNQLKELDKQNNLTQEILAQFCWDKGFLGDNSGDGSSFEDPSSVVEQLGLNFKWDGNIGNILPLVSIRSPDMNFDASRNQLHKWNDDLTSTEKYLTLLRILQINEEIRHYWAIRTIRLLRLIAPGQTEQETWRISDYIQYVTLK